MLRTELPAAAQLMLLTATALLTMWQVIRPAPLPELAIDGNGGLRLADGETWRELEIMDDSLVSPALVVLRYRLPGQRARTLVLLPDSAAADDLRRLRVALRWKRHTRSDTSSPDAG